MNIYVIVKYEDSDNAQSAVLSVDNLLDYVRNQFDYYTSAEAIIAYVDGDDYEHWFTRAADNIRWQVLAADHLNAGVIDLGMVNQEAPDPNAKQEERDDWEARYRAAKQTAKGWS